MPRTRQMPLDKLWGTVMSNAMTMPMVAEEVKAKMGRPKKFKMEACADATITPVANGYIVTSSTTGKSMFVFPEIDKAFDFIRTSLKPTSEQEAFLGKV